MKRMYKQKNILVVFLWIIAGHGYTYSSNPASEGYVDEAVEAVRQEGVYTAGTAISIVNNIISGAYTAGAGVVIRGAEIAETTVSVGDAFQGGTVFYVDETGRHGLIFNTPGFGTSALLEFLPASTVLVSAPGTGIGTGAQNTALWNAAFILSNTDNTGGAAQLISSYSVQSNGTVCPVAATGSINTTVCYGGYYIPSLKEFELLINSGEFNPTSDLTYWTSTSDPSDTSSPGSAFAIDFTAPSTFVVISSPTTSLYANVAVRQF